jgi:hypothetical protein
MTAPVVELSEFLAANSEVPGSIPFGIAADLERGPLSLMRATEELHERKVADPA